MRQYRELDPDGRSYSQVLASAIFRQGPIPQHVAVIMDGNRRYAKGRNTAVIEGHGKGRERSLRFLRWAKWVSIKEVTLYAFSIENFKRTQEEINDLIDIVYDTLESIVIEWTCSNHPDSFYKNCILQTIGNWDLMPEKLKPVMAKLHMLSRGVKNPDFKINLAFAYTGRDAIFRSCKSIYGSPFLQQEDVTEALITETQNFFPLRPVDLLIRTGGDTRISDFLLWETDYTHLEFIPKQWPEISYSELAQTLIRYQASRKHFQGIVPRNASKLTPKATKFLNDHRDSIWKQMEIDGGKFQFPKNLEFINFPISYGHRLFRKLVEF